MNADAKLEKNYRFKVYLLNGAYIGSCDIADRSSFLRFYMQSQKLKRAPRVEFRLVKK